MIQIDPKDRQELISCLAAMPEMRGEEERKISLENAALKDLIPQIELSGEPILAVNSLVAYLLNYGRLKNEELAFRAFLSSLQNSNHLEPNLSQLIQKLLSLCDRNRIELKSRPKRQSLLLKQINCEIIDRFKTYFKPENYIILDKFEDPRQVDSLRSMDMTMPNLPPRKLAPQTTILQFYDRVDIGGRFLLLGDSGAGKTTTLLKLAQTLVERAYMRSLHPIPILLNLSSWHDNKQKIARWIVENLKLKYGIDRESGRKLLAARNLILLLDGLDEVAESRQKLCVQKINQFLLSYHRTAKVIVCSETEAYYKTKELIKLNGSIRLEPLKNTQIEDILLWVSDDRIRDNWQQNPDFIELTRTPLLLNIWLNCYQQISLSKWKQLPNKSQKIDYLLALYIKQKLARDREENVNYKHFKIQLPSKKQQPDPADAINYLSCLAIQVTARNQTEIFKDNIQSYWLTPQKKNFISGLLIGVIIGLTIKLIIVIVIRLAIGLAIGLVVGIVYGITGGLRLDDYQGINLKPKQLLIIGIKQLINGGTIAGIIIGLMGGLGVGLIARPLGGGLIEGLILGLSVGAIEQLIEELKTRKIYLKKYVPQTIKTKFKKTVKDLSILSLFLFIIFWSLSKTFPQLSQIASIPIAQLIRLFGATAVMGFIWLGAFSTMQKFTIRTVLWLSGYAPWQYLPFLEYCCDRQLIQRVAGGYCFAHSSLQKYFANLWYEKQQAKNN